MFRVYRDPRLDFWFNTAIIGICLSTLGHVALIFFVWFS